MLARLSFSMGSPHKECWPAVPLQNVTTPKPTLANSIWSPYSYGDLTKALPSRRNLKFDF